MALAIDGGLRLVERIQLCGEVYGLAFLESGDLAAAGGDAGCTVWTRSPLRAAVASVREEHTARALALQAARQPPPGPTAGGAGGAWDHSTDVTLGGRKMSLQW